ncbi:MAG: hypothetical protein NT128_00310 [Proteobacteria bacterium]|nr:hypothetical protein [Pseudomonadota bacterium]
MIFSSTEVFAKIKRPHVGNPAKAIKNKAKKAGGSIKKGAAKAGKSLAVGAKLINKGLKMAGLPNYDDIKKTAKCIVPTLKDVNALRKNPKNVALLKKLRKNPCVEEVKALKADCQGPAAFTAQMVPNLGGPVTAICNKISMADSDITSALDRAEQIQAFAMDPAGEAAKELAGEDDSEPEDDSDG